MKTSDKILLGIFNHWPRLDEPIKIESSELAWLLYNGLTNWRVESGWQKIRYSLDDTSFFDLQSNDKSKVTKELSILKANECIYFDRPTGFDGFFQITLRPKGLIRAERLSSRLGKIELWYRENKNGILGLVVTVVVAIITAYITSKIVTKGN